ncbi:hypothetical protein O5D80_006838 [Batrachochytrium dendrobatidis]|nr:hypothetical protein O5D80_006838 [Batrachochytrium dendrobatidis]
MSLQSGRQSRRISWSPLPATKQLFLLYSGTDLKLCEWTGQDSQPGTDSVHQTRAVAIHTNTALIKSVSWCQDSKFPGVFAIGNVSGKVSLVNLASFSVLDGLSWLTSTDQQFMSETPSNGISSETLLFYRSLLKNCNHIPLRSEYVPSNTRSCNVVSFSPTNTQLLLAGFDKVRSDHCLYIWDICSTQAEKEKSEIPSSKNVTAFESPSLKKAIFRCGSSEGISSAAWMMDSAARVVVGIGFRSIRSYDLRVDSGQGPVFSVNTKAIHGLAADPFCINRFTSFGDDGIVRVWDERKITEPILTLNPEFRFGISNISWSPTRYGLLQCSGKDSSTIKFFHIHDAFKENTNNALVPSFNQVEHDLQYPPQSEPVDHHSVSLASNVLVKSQHPVTSPSAYTLKGVDVPLSTQESRMAFGYESFIWKNQSVRTNDGMISDFTWIPYQCHFSLYATTFVGDEKIRISKLPSVSQLSFSPSGMISTSNDTFVEFWGLDSAERSQDEDLDIATSMCNRVQEGYGFDCQLNIKISSSNQQLNSLWQLISMIIAEPVVDGSFDVCNPRLSSGDPGFRATDSQQNTSIIDKAGMIGILQLITSREPDTVASSFADENTVSGLSSKRILALRLCGYSIDQTAERGDLDPVSLNFDQHGYYERMAGMELFYSGNLDGAIECLYASKENHLQLLAAALAGLVSSRLYTSSASGLQGQEIFKNLGADQTNPYVRAMFTFATSNGDWNCVLKDDSLSLADRIAVAVRFVGNDELVVFLEDLTKKAIAEGRIDGLLLTGLGAAGIDLIESYVNQTGDIQTASLILTMCGLDASADARVDNWIETYRGLLDRWQLYHQRAHFDIQRRKKALLVSSMRRFSSRLAHTTVPVVDRISPQVHVRCNFCSQPISNIIQHKRSPQLVGMLATGVQKHKSTTCQHCGKSLPRCAICCQSMGGNMESIYSAMPALGIANDSDTEHPAKIDSWFTWCQSCKHGGHTRHILDWFKQHSVCPVTDCACQCLH